MLGKREVGYNYLSIIVEKNEQSAVMKAGENNPVLSVQSYMVVSWPPSIFFLENVIGGLYAVCIHELHLEIQ